MTAVAREVVRNFLILIDVWKIHGGRLTKVDMLSSPGFGIPTTYWISRLAPR